MERKLSKRKQEKIHKTSEHLRRANPLHSETTNWENKKIENKLIQFHPKVTESSYLPKSALMKEHS